MIDYIVFDNKKCNKEDIAKFILEQDKMFSVPLSERIDIKKFIEKIVSKAIIIKAVSKNDIIAMSAFYANDQVNFKSYLTFLAVDNRYRNNGIANNLIDIMFDVLKEKEMLSVELTTGISNIAARRLYEKKGFKLIETYGERVRYKYILDKEKCE